MLKSLLSIRFRSFAASLLHRGKNDKKHSRGTILLYVILYGYLGAVMCGFSTLIFYSLAAPYHALGLDWLYFSMAGLISLCLSVLTGIFATQNQLYDAKDNALLLSMPIPPRYILLSRLIPLLVTEFFSACLVMVPAIVVYAFTVDFSVLGILLQTVGIVAITLLAKVIAGILAWLLHLLLSKLNKSAASVLFVLVFLPLYWVFYNNISDILNVFTQNPEAIADALNGWVWPIYAMGSGCAGNFVHMLAFIAIAGGLFALLCWVLSATFLRLATLTQRSGKRKKLELNNLRTRSALSAIIRKELRKFVSSPVYLTNMGLGILLIAILPILALVFRDKLTQALAMLPFLEAYKPLLICAVLSFMISTMNISTPSVSLEGKNLWILRSLPLPSFTVLNGKLLTHIVLTMPVCAVCGLLLSLILGCSIPQILLCTIAPSLLCLANGLLGMLTGLKWARLDYINDAYPCKQSASVAVSMFATMGFPLIMGICYVYLLAAHMGPELFLTLICGLLLLLSGWMYRALRTWGVAKFETL